LLTSDNMGFEFRPLLCFFFASALCGQTAARNEVFFEPAHAAGTYLARAGSQVVGVRGDALTWTRGETLVCLRARGASVSDWQATEKDGGQTYYFIGNDPSKWRREVPHYRRLRREGLYPGIDMVLRGQGSEIEMEWLVAAHSDPGQIDLELTGGVARLDAAGDLLVETPEGVLRYRHPRAFQDGRSVAAAWDLRGQQLRIALGSFDAGRPLLIDPETAWVERVGGNDTDQVVGGWSESSYAVIVGNTRSSLWASHFLNQPVSNQDVMIIARDLRFPENSSFVTIVGGSRDDTALAANARWIGGSTNSTDFPVSFSTFSRSMQPVYGGGSSDGFLLSLFGNFVGSPSAGTYIGGSGEDAVRAVGDGWFAGETTSADLPVQAAVQSVYGGGTDGFFGRWFSQPTMVSYWGGSDFDAFYALLPQTEQKRLRLAGRTTSSDFPVIDGEGQQGMSDGILVTMDTASGAITQSTHWGGAQDDSIAGLAALPGGGWALAANTRSLDLPVLGGGQAAVAGAEAPAVLEYRSARDGAVSFRTYYGGSGSTVAHGLGFYGSEVVAFGTTNSPDLPTRDALQTDLRGLSDGWWAIWSAAGEWKQGSFWGGDSGDSIDFAGWSPEGGLLVAGTTSSPRVPEPAVEIFEGARDRAASLGASDGFVALIRSSEAIQLQERTAARGSNFQLQLRVWGFRDPVSFIVTVEDPARAVFAGGRSSTVLRFPADFSNGRLARDLGLRALSEGETGITVKWGGGEFKDKLRVLPLLGIWQSSSISIARGKGADASFALTWRDPASGETGPVTCIGDLFATPKRVRVEPPIASARLSNASCGGGSFSLDAREAGRAQLLVDWPELGVEMPPIDIEIRAPRFAVQAPPALSRDLAIDLSVSGLNESTEFLVTSETPELLLLRQGSNWNTPSPLGTSLRVQNGTVGLVGLANAGQAVLRVESPGAETVRIVIPLRPLTYVLRRFEEFVENSRFFPASIFSSSSAAGPGEPIQLIVTAIPRGVDPRQRLVYDPVNDGGRSFEWRVEQWAADGPRTTYARIINGLVRFWTVAAPNATRYLRVVEISDPDPDAPVYYFERRPAITGRTVILGHQLETEVSLSPKLRNGAVRLVSGDARLLLATGATAPAAAAVTLGPLSPFANQGQIVTLVANSSAAEFRNVVEVPVSLYVGDQLSETWRVRLVPAALGLYSTFARAASPNSVLNIGIGGPGNVRISAFALDPDSGEARLPQRLRRGLNPVRTTVRVSGPLQGGTDAVLTPQNSIFDWAFQPLSLGEGTISVTQSAGFVEPASGSRLRFRVQGYRWSSPQPLELAPNTQAPLRFGPAGGSGFPDAGEVELESADPGRLLLSLDPLEPGKASVRIRVRPGFGQQSIVYAQAIGGSPGDEARVLVRGATTETSTLTVLITGLQLRFSLQFGSSDLLSGDNPSGPNPDFTVNPSAPPLLVPLFLSTLTPPGARPGEWRPPALALRPGAAPLEIALAVTGDTGAGALSPAVITFQPGDESRSLRFVPLRAGEVAIESLFGSTGRGAPLSPLRIRVDGPRLAAQTLLLGRNLQGSVGLGIPFPLASGPPASVTITSEDASRLLVAAASNETGSSSITIPWVSNPSFFVQALDGVGIAHLRVTAAGYPELRVPVTVAETQLAFSPGFASLIAGTKRPGSVSVQLSPAVPSSQLSRFGSVGAALRWGAPPLEVGFVIDPAGLVQMEPARLVIQPGKQSGEANVLPLAAGSGAVRLMDTPGVQVDSRSFAFRVEALRLNAQVSAPQAESNRFRLTESVVTAGSVSLNALPAEEIQVRVESLNPDLVRVAASPTGEFGEALTLTGFSPEFPGRYWVRAFAASGLAQLRFSAPGLDPVVLQVSLAPISVTLRPDTTTIFTNQGSIQLTARLSSDGQLVEGVSLPLTFSSSAPEVADVEPKSVVLRDGTPVTLRVTPRRAGRVSILVAGTSQPVPPVQLEILEPTVRLQELFSTGFSLGQWATKPYTVSFSGRTPPAGTVVSLQSRDATGVLVSMNRNLVGTATVSTSIQANQSTAQFHLQGLRASGTVTLVLSATGYASTEYVVTLTPAGVTARIPELRVNEPGRFGLVLCETVRSAGGEFCAEVRAAPQMPPQTVSATVNDSTVLQLIQTQATLNVSDQDNWGLAVRALRFGQASVTLTAQPASANNGRALGFSIFR
jgi:hypothetical protein